MARLRHSIRTETDPGRRARLARELAAPVAVELVFDSQVTQKQIDDFVALGGTIRHLYQAVSYGWSGTLPATTLDALQASMGPSLLAVTDDRPAHLHMDEATRSGRVRQVWGSGFAGVAGGVSGTSDITIGILDSGVDDSHTDLAGRNEYWRDYTSDAEATPRDVLQHGSHVTGIALGTGASFGVGPGTLRYTDSGDLTGAAANAFVVSMVHLPTGPIHFTQNSVFAGGSTSLYLVARSNGASTVYLTFNSTTGSSPLSLVSDFNGNDTQGFSTALVQNAGRTITTYSTVNTVSNYPAVGDGFNAMRGVAAGTRWAGAKVFTNAGAGSSTTIGAAIDDLVSQRVAHNIKVINLSLGINGTPGLDSTLRSKVNSAVNNGIVAVCSAGNDGPGAASTDVVDDPGRAALALTVGASNDVNALTKYSSAGFASPGTDEDTKPDLLAPGGSDYYSQILSVDSNDGDTGKPGTADRVANDMLNMKGTSMSAPFAAGAAALVIDALQKSGVTWDFASSAQPRLVKMLLCAASTETNAPREVSSGNNPTLGRAAAPKDLFEGYGVLNPDAAVEAVLQSWRGDTLGDSTAGGSFDRRAWGRRLGITTGASVTITLTVPATADYDLYLYSGTPDAKGNPVIVASSTNAGLGATESITVVPTDLEPRYLFIKRVSGNGAWSLASQVASGRCGDGTKTAGEQCDDGNTANGDCCSSTCALESDGSPCNDGLFCTATDSCVSGTCKGSGDPCTGGPECRTSCNEGSNDCFNAAGTACSADSLPCTTDLCDGAGNCAHAAGNAGKACRAAAGICDVAESCSGASTACPPDSFASAATICRAAAGACDSAESCTGSSATCPADSLLPSTTVCRAAAGVCDIAENCSGSSTACPADSFASPATACRMTAGVCDVAELCTGSSASCPANTFLSSATVCRASAGVCDGQETCTGSSAACPADLFLSNATTCRAATGVCDAAETCSGSSAACPADSFLSNSKICRTAAGACDAPETCSGSSASCPTDSFLSSSKVCRAAAGACDAPETCSGSSASCPGDSFLTGSTVCRGAVGVCDAAETCSGSSAACPDDTFLSGSTICRAAAGICDAPETCTGNSASCPDDSFLSNETICRIAAGVCDATETCTGASASCPANSFLSNSTTCRTATGACDVAESCSGSSAACPGDAVAANTLLCRESAGECDAPEYCTGQAKACPVDQAAADGAACTDDGNPCTTDACDSTTGSCTHADNAAPCDDGLFCDGLDTCHQGTCSLHSGSPCPGGDGDANCSESCDEKADDCAAPDPEGSPCNDGDTCTTGDKCQGGTCSGAPSTAPECTVTTTTLPEIVCGDANGDGRITSSDALRTLRSAVAGESCPLDICDFNGDGRLSASDALGILRSAVGQAANANCPPPTLALLEDAVPVTSTVPLTSTTTIEDDGGAIGYPAR